METPKEEFTALEGECFKNATVYRTIKKLYNQETSVILTFNPQLYNAQWEGMWNNICKCIKKLDELQASLNARVDGEITKGKKPTVDSVNNKISGILSAQYMKDVFEYQVLLSDKKLPVITYSLNDQKLVEIKDKYLGKALIFTDHKDWPNEKIVSSYRSQYHIEDCFKQMKDIEHLGFRPILHWTDQMIRVHAFYCVLALMLCSILNKEIENIGYKMSINAMLDMLNEVQQVITVFPQRKGKKHINKSSFSNLEGTAKIIIEKLDLLKYQIKL
jgi:transposase